MLASHRTNELSAVAAARELGLSRARFYKLYSQYLQACAQGQAEVWSPGVSGGDHHPDWPADVTALLTKLLSSKPPSAYSAAASELLRRLQFETDRASVRRWAIANQLAPDTRYKPVPKPVKRWQARDLGALWQYDASPHAWLPGNPRKQSLLDLLDDATRYNTGARLYERENLLAHFDFLPRSFQTHGLPLALYVDYHSFFFTHVPEAFTQLGAALHFYGVALRYAPTPQAKGKIERRHDFWQKRLPPLLAADQILELEGANRLLDQLLPHVNQHEIHRELGTTPHTAGSKPWRKTAPSCGLFPTVLGGPLSGASKPTCASAMTAKSPSAANANPWMLHRVPRSSAACDPTATAFTCATLPIPKPNPSSCSIAQSSKSPVSFCSHTKVSF